MSNKSYEACFIHCKNLIKNHHYEEAMTCSHELLDLYEKEKSQVPLENVFEGVESFFLNVPNGILHLTYLNRLSRLYEDKKMYNKQLKTMYDIAYDYIDATEFTLARSILNRGLQMARSHGYSDREADFLNGLGRIFNEKNDLNKGLYYYKKAYQLSIEVGYDHGKRITHNIAYTLGRLKRYDEALHYFNLTIKFMCQENNPSYCANTYNEIGYIYIKLKDYAQAKDALSKAYDLSIEAGSFYFLCENYEFFSLLYESMGKYSKALEYYKAFHVQHEKISKDKNKQILKNYAYEKSLEKKSVENQAITLKNIELDNYAKELDLVNQALDEALKAQSDLENQAEDSKNLLQENRVKKYKIDKIKDQYAQLREDWSVIKHNYGELKKALYKHQDFSEPMSILDMKIHKIHLCLDKIDHLYRLYDY